MKKFLSILFVFVLTLSLTGCNDSLYGIIKDDTKTYSSELEKENSMLRQELERLQNQLDAINDKSVNYADIMETVNKTSTEYMKSNVTIITTGYKMIGPLRYDSEGGQGSGVIFKISDDGRTYYCLTNNHVTYIDPEFNVVSYKITDYKSNVYAGTLLHSSKDYDLSILKFTKSNDLKIDLMSLNLVKANPSVDQIVVSLGQPKGQKNTITIGKVKSYTNVAVENGKSDSDVKFKVIAHSAPIDRGSSGGVLINLDGEIVGINFAGSVDANDAFVEGYAIPCEKVIEFLNLNNFTL